MSRIRFAPIAAALLMTAGPAAAQPPEPVMPSASPETCVEVDEVNGWSVTGDRVIELRVGANRLYRVELGASAEVAALGSRARIKLVGNSLGDLCRTSGAVVADGRRLTVVSITRVDADDGRQAAPR
ncbi:hypothetical protein [Rhodospirillum centenum]|uniref:Uncharacterized protein n=1 Tax=Rhodospirillum centenum (strain ATCC 51521 / SW) TaxID=414684 RepID=B6INH9_RHOCS|nr:hypothetical protein [Rhodospirillum centenum]ACI99076.1 hypothetical protein RC1_1678 [Rhodospirillum centenum SW]